MQKHSLNPWQVRQTSVEIDLGSIRSNFEKIKRRNPASQLTAVIKSDGYGHGAVSIARALNKLPKAKRPHAFAVANVEEGLELRSAGIREKIYVLSGVQSYDEDLQRCLDTCNLTPVISSFRVLQQAAKLLGRKNKKQKIHLKFNSGMNRLGIDPDEVASTFRILKKSNFLEVEGIMSHFACSETPDSGHTQKQIQYFKELVEQFSLQGIKPEFCHFENSAGQQHQLFPKGNMSRIGLHLYGVGDENLAPTLSWKAQIYQTREIPKKAYVGYGPLFQAKKKMKIAILGVGYADGYRRALSNQAEVLISATRCKVIGAVSMDLTAVDVSHLEKISLDQCAVLIGKQGSQKITTEELAKKANCIPYEILTGISTRVPRKYINE